MSPERHNTRLLLSVPSFGGVFLEFSGVGLHPARQQKRNIVMKLKRLVFQKPRNASSYLCWLDLLDLQRLIGVNRIPEIYGLL